MSSTSSKSRMVSFRLPNEVRAKIERALEWPSNGNSSVSDYCKKVVIRHAFRHERKPKESE